MKRAKCTYCIRNWFPIKKVISLHIGIGILHTYNNILNWLIEETDATELIMSTATSTFKLVLSEKILLSIYLVNFYIAHNFVQPREV